MKGAMLLAAAAAALVLASPAGAVTYQVAGKQKVIDADAGTSTMTGGLRGAWKTTARGGCPQPVLRGQGHRVVHGLHRPTPGPLKRGRFLLAR
jgi:hypothetical protein